MSERAHIFLVDDDPLVLPSLAAVLERAGYRVSAFSSAESAVAGLSTQKPALVITDLTLPGKSGLMLLEEIQTRTPGLPVLLITAFGSVENAVLAMRSGARDYVLKPIHDADLLQKIARALEEDHLRHEVRELRRRAGKAQELPLIGNHPAMLKIQVMVDAVAATRATVLIRGESGTGKTLLARAIHAASERAAGPFVEFSCGALPDPLLESELFGYEKGAFTGADRERAGKVEAAHGGTLFLDEIANATPALQMKLLRVLQDRVFERLGSVETRRVDVRLILATHADLESFVREGKFREDLFYRIHVVNIEIPPVRERASDIPSLVEHFLRKYAAEYKKDLLECDPAALSVLCAYEWPGNVREIENAMEHAVVLCRGKTITLDHLPARLAAAFSPDFATGTSLKPSRIAMEGPEREYIRRALKLNDGNRQKTADMLEVNRTTLFNKMKKYKLFDPESKASDSLIDLSGTVSPREPGHRGNS